MRHFRTAFTLLLLLQTGLAAYAGTGVDTPAATANIQERFNSNYKDFLGAGSQSLLPFPQLEAQAWKKLQAAKPMRRIYTEDHVFYNNKTYSFTLYQTDDGSYYLDAKGGFWGMDELFYGPIEPHLLQ